MFNPLRIEGKRDVRLQCDVDRLLATRLDATAKQHDVPREAVIRAAFEQSLPKG